MAVSQSTGCAVASWPRLFHSSLKSRGSTTSVPTRSLRVTSDLYIDDMRAWMSVKKASGAGSPIARRYAFVGHLRNAKNTAAVIDLLVSIMASIMPDAGHDTQSMARPNALRSQRHQDVVAAG